MDKQQQHYGAPSGYQQPAYTQQPTATPGMNLGGGGGNKNALNKPYNAQGERDWSHGGSDCFADCLTCLVAWWLPCIVYGQNKTRLEHLERQGYPHPEGGESCGGDCFTHGLLTACCGMGCIVQMSGRERVRQRYRIEGGGCGDFCCSWCCAPCALTQESRELELEERSMMPSHLKG